jgi:hypothetical protein
MIVKSSSGAQSATSLPPAPRDEVSSRMTKYFIMMSVRVACFVLMVVVTPYGWYTWVFALGAVVLPYIAVVVANVGSDTKPVVADSPERALPAAPASPPVAQGPTVIRIDEQPKKPQP